jgi:hypothetical protein
MLITLYLKFFNNLFKSWQCNTTEYLGTKKFNCNEYLAKYIYCAF